MGANIVLTDNCKQDIQNGNADYIRGDGLGNSAATLRFTGLDISNKRLSFLVGEATVAVLEFPAWVNFSAGETVTVEFGGHMAFNIE